MIREPEAVGIGIASASLGRAEIGAREAPNIKEGIRDNIELTSIQKFAIKVASIL